MGKKRKKRRAPRTIPVLPLVGVGAAVYEPVRRAVSGDMQGGLTELVQRSTGIDVLGGSGWHPEWLASFWLPIIVTTVGHKIANITGINRVFSRLPAPLNKLRL